MRKLILIFSLLCFALYGQAQIIRCSPAYNKVASEEGGGGSTLLNGLIAYYCLEESSGQLVDVINAYNTTSVAGLTYQQAGKVNYCILMDGATSNATIGDNSNFDLQNFTLGGWMKTEAYYTPLFSNLINAGGGNYYGYGINLSNGNPTVFLCNGESYEEAVAQEDYDIRDNTWHFIAGTYDHTTLKIYVDGVLQDDQNSTSMDIGFTGAVVRIGYVDEAITDGSLDEIFVYGRVLGQSGIDSLYNAGNGVTYPFE